MALMIAPGTYDEALERFHRSGPEFEGWLSNHGPMVVEALARRGKAADIHRWTDGYAARLDERPRGIAPIRPEAWRDPLGDATRTGDWIDLMLLEVREGEWRDVLARWWPRLLPGIAAGATHGVIRVGHAVQALAAYETQPRLDELAHALAYWAARWQPIPRARPAGTVGVADALAAIPPVAEQQFGIRSRLAQLETTDGWAEAVEAADLTGDPVQAVEAIVDAAVARYAAWGHGQPTMLVHAATAPAAVARVLPHLPADLALASVAPAWAASCAVVAAYRPATDAPIPDVAGRDAEEVWESACSHRGEHVIKLADTALASDERTHRTAGVAATLLAIELDA